MCYRGIGTFPPIHHVSATVKRNPDGRSPPASAAFSSRIPDPATLLSSRLVDPRALRESMSRQDAARSALANRAVRRSPQPYL